jgi:hypothetical protein
MSKTARGKRGRESRVSQEGWHHLLETWWFTLNERSNGHYFSRVVLVFVVLSSFLSSLSVQQCSMRLRVQRCSAACLQNAINEESWLFIVFFGSRIIDCMTSSKDSQAGLPRSNRFATTVKTTVLQRPLHFHMRRHFCRIQEDYVLLLRRIQVQEF